MPTNSPIPRLSIVVPIGRDLAAFERTLISVLENRPPSCEILVAHDGSYDDPFDLCDEVEFVVADSGNFVNLVSTAALLARGCYVHILADGVRATTTWVDAALEKFEHADAGAVAPVIREAASQQIIAGGWCDGVDRLCKSAWQGREPASKKESLVIGAYLQASFWRREILCSLSKAFLSDSSEESAYVYEHLMRDAGWRCVLAEESDVLCDAPQLPWESTSMRRGSRLRAIRHHFGHRGVFRSACSAVGAVLSSLLSLRYLRESLGQLIAPLSGRRLVRQLGSAKLPRPGDQEVILALPNAGPARPLGRAA